MKNIYIVTSGDYSDYHICAVFETEELAKRYIESFKQYNDMGIETFTLNDTAPDNGLSAYFVRMLRDGDVEMVNQESSDYGFNGMAGSTQVLKTVNGTKLFVHCFAKDEAHAVKIAGEKRREIIANGQWE